MGQQQRRPRAALEEDDDHRAKALALVRQFVNEEGKAISKSKGDD
jgi:hypothetical protein